MKRNIIPEQAKFNSRSQRAGESVDSFITDLYGLARYCNFGTLNEELIRDRIDVGFQNPELSEKTSARSKICDRVLQCVIKYHVPFFFSLCFLFGQDNRTKFIYFVLKKMINYTADLHMQPPLLSNHSSKTSKFSHLQPYSRNLL